MIALSNGRTWEEIQYSTFCDTVKVMGLHRDVSELENRFDEVVQTHTTLLSARKMLINMYPVGGHGGSLRAIFITHNALLS